MVKKDDSPEDDMATDSVKGADDPLKLTRHHRKLASQNGNDDPHNISFVPLYKHRAWHILYDDLPPLLIIENFRQDYEVFGTDFTKSPLMKKLHEGWANSTAQKIKRREAWYTLFADKTLEQIVEEINTMWLDPAYEIMIGMVRIKTVQLKEALPACNRSHLH